MIAVSARHLRSAVVLILAGGLTNTALCVLLAVAAQSYGTERMPRWGPTLVAFVKIRDLGGYVSYTEIQSIGVRESQTYGGLDATTGRWFEYRSGTAVEFDDLAAHLRESDRHWLLAPPDVHRNRRILDRSTLSVGLPFLALDCRTEEVKVRPPSVFRTVTGGIEWGDTVIPLTPRARGFAANSLLFAAMILGLKLAFARSTWRRIRGACPNCGYAVRELPTCPECGVGSESN